MKSLNFPNMFNTNSTRICIDEAAIKQNAALLLQSNRREFTFDPDFGPDVRSFLFNQNSYMLKDLLVNDLYSACAIYLGKVIKTTRNDIKVVQKDNSLWCAITGINQSNYKKDELSIKLAEGQYK